MSNEENAEQQGGDVATAAQEVVGMTFTTYLILDVAPRIPVHVQLNVVCLSVTLVSAQGAKEKLELGFEEMLMLLLALDAKRPIDLKHKRFSVQYCTTPREAIEQKIVETRNVLRARPFTCYSMHPTDSMTAVVYRDVKLAIEMASFTGTELKLPLYEPRVVEAVRRMMRDSPAHYCEGCGD